MNRDEVRCRDVVALLTDYLEGALPVEDRVALEQHLLTCEGCTAFLAQLRTSIALTGALDQEEVAPALMDAVLALYRQRQST
ncbi:anti-sigma factor family protein [Nocardioides iriomotensis]|uniref:Anti-sigma factor n=1 Tax=Nocardioides iriomotensis TaxID=715784 RepID=A0A4Q5IVI1_9ACTN|nr:zf-HC2 domain-containing protein [Nocardioides iriomotensis]RYU09823.1 anti-sigma factor [Nocardioides iriomotensis]